MHGARRPKSHAFHSSDPFLVLCFRSLLVCFNCTHLHTHFRSLQTINGTEHRRRAGRGRLRAHGHARPRRHHTSLPPHPPSSWLYAMKWPSLRSWIRNSMLGARPARRLREGYRTHARRHEALTSVTQNPLETSSAQSARQWRPPSASGHLIMQKSLWTLTVCR